MRKHHAAIGVLLTGALVGALGAPARAAVGDPTSPPPLDSQRAAAAEVLDFLARHPRPVSPGAGAEDQTRARHAEAQEAFLRGFPMTAGIVQWGCRPLGSDRVVEVELAEDHGEFTGSAPTSISMFGLDCGAGAPPTLAQITSVRPGLLPPEAATSVVAPAPEAQEECVLIREAEHCFELVPDLVIARFRWLGGVPLSGMFRLGHYPSYFFEQCVPGHTAYLFPPWQLGPGDSLVVFHRPIGTGLTYSSTFDEIDRFGSGLGTRSVHCKVGP